MNNFRLLAVAAAIFLLASTVELIYSHILFAAGCLSIGIALVVAAYGARTKPFG